MADIRLMRPGAGEVQNITCAPEARFIFDFPTDEATLSRSGDNLVITFEDGATLQLENFYTAYSSKNMPSFEVEGAEISGEDFFTAMNEPDLMPAACPGGNAGAQSNGNRFHSYVNSELLGGLDRLGGLDIGWNDGGQDSELDGGGGGHVDFGVTLTGESGEVPDPSIPVIDDPTYPDQPGWDQTVTGRDVLNVKESELDGAGSRSVDHGSLLVDARDGVASIVIDGVTVYEGTEPPVLHADARVNTDEGYLTNFRYSAATGRLEYDYVLTQATTEHKGEGKDSIAHNFHVTVTDTDGDTGTGLITVVIEDDVPLAADDAAGLEENEIVSGNVVTGEVDTTGTTEGFVSVGKDDYGADAAATTNGLVWNLDSWGEKASYDAATGTWTVVTDYGTATLHADGSFTFDALKNAGLDEGVSASMNFDYTITDADGDSSSATLTVTVTGDTQPVVTFDNPDTNSNAITVDEALIPGKGNAENLDNAAHVASGEGSFTVNFKGESGDVTLTYGKDESAQTVTLRLEQGRQTVAPSEGGNTLIVNGVTVTVTGAEQQSDGSWAVNYTYNLETGQEHGNDERIGDDDVLSGTIDITVKDDTDDYAYGHIDVSVHDDGPVVTPVATEYKGHEYFNTVSVSFGADNDTDDGSHLAVNAYEVDADGQNPRLITWTKGDGSTSCGFDLSSLSQGEWTSADGNIIVSRGKDGNFVFKIKENGTNADIKVTATDADGDTDSKTLHLTAPDSGSNSIIVDEALLSDGSIVNSDDSEHHASGTGSFTVDLHGEDGTVTLTYDTGETTGENAPTVTVSLINGVTFSNSWLSSKNMQDSTRPNTFMVNGVTVEVKGAEQQDDGSWKIIYSYELNGEQAHPKGGTYNNGANIGANDAVSDTIDITVTDATGDTATGELTVTVHDDGPVLNGLSNSTGADAMLNESTGSFVVSLDGFHTGADMVNGTTPAKVTVAVGGQTYTFTVSSGTHGYVFTPVAGQGNAVSIEHGENGYELHYTRPEGDVQSSGTSSYTFTVTVTDADGDSVSKNITLTTKDRPDISFGTAEGSVKEAGVEGCEVPAESTSPDDPNAEVSGDPDAGGTITLTDTDSAALTLTVSGDVVSEATLSVAASSGDTLTLYLNAAGKLVTDQPSDNNYYGTLTLDFSKGKNEDGTWSFKLHEGSDLVNSLNEGESFDITLKLKATDADDYSSTGAALTIHIQGTNDMPVFTTATANGKTLSITEDKGFSSVGDIEVTDGKNDGGESSGVDVSSKIEGKLTATDPDDDAKASGHLTFTVTGLKESDAGTVKDGVYESYGDALGTSDNSDRYDNLVSNDGQTSDGSDDKGSFTQVTTQYGTLKVYTDGSYTYTPNDTSKIGGDEYVTETFTVKVQDAHGSFSEQTITITLRDEDNGITGGAEISQSLREEGVVGDDESLGAPSKGADIYVPRSDGTAVNEGTTEPNNVLFTDADLNDTVKLTIGGTNVNLVQANGTSEGTVGSIAEQSVTVGIVGSSSTVLYLVATENSDGTWKFSWKETTIATDDVVGKLTLSRESDGDVSYSFALDPKNTDPTKTTDNSGFLEQLDQGDVVNIDLGFTAGGATSYVDLTITGTNDRPTVSFDDDSTAEKQDTLYASGVGRENDDADVVITDDGSTLNPAEMYGYKPSDTVSGNLKASDPDAGDSTTFFISGITPDSTGKISFDRSEDSNTVTVLLDDVKVGTLVLDPETGNYSFTLETGDGNPLQKYAEDTEFSFTVDFKAQDSHTSTSANSVSVEITLTATNDAPKIEITDPEEMNLNVAASDSSDSATVTATDIDTTDTLTYGLLTDAAYNNLSSGQSVQMTNSISLGNWGTVTMASDGTYTFYLNKENSELAALRQDEEKELTFHVVVRDDKGAYDIKEVTITITGEASAAVFRGSAAVGVVKEEGVTPPAPGGDENDEVEGTPSVSGKLDAVAIDHGGDGKAQEVQYSVNGHEDAETQSFSSLDYAIQTAINDKFGETNWTGDADVTVVQGTYGTLYLNNNTGQYFYQLDNGNEATNALKQGEIKNENFTIHAEGAYDAAHGGTNGADQQLIISVQGTNDAPTLDGVLVGGQTVSPDENGNFTISGVQEDGVQEVSGSLVGDDVDSAPTSLTYLIKVADGENSYRYLASASNDYGFLTLDEATGEYTFTLNNKAAQALNEGETGQASFTVVVKDEHGAISEEKELVFNIEGTNDTASINSVTLETNEDATEAVSGEAQRITISDVDAGAKEFTSVTFKDENGTENTVSLDGEAEQWSITGAYGTLTLTKNADGTLSYSYKLEENGRDALQHLNKGDVVKEQFTVTGTSGTGEGMETVSGIITVNINGENDAPFDLEWATDGKPEGESAGIINNDFDGSVLNVKDWNSVGGKVVGSDVDNETPELRYYVAKGAADSEQEQNPSTLQTVKGEYGYLTINAQTGEFSYTVDTLSDAYQALNGDTQPGRESFTIIVADPDGKTHEETIHFDVSYYGGNGGGQAPVLGDNQTPVDVEEDGGEYFETDEDGNPVLDAEDNPIDLTPPPSVDSGWNGLVDVNGKPVQVVPSAIWLVDGDDNHTHVVNTEYGSLILEQGENGNWGYRFVLDNSSDTVQALGEGEQRELTFHVQTSEMEDKTSTITVTVTGLNDRPVIEAHEDLVVKDVDDADTENIAENSDGGGLTTSDPDAGDVGTGEPGTQNLSYSVVSSENCSVGEPKEKENGDLVYTVTGTWKDATITWGEFTLHENGSYSFTASDAAKVLLKGENPIFHLTIEADDGSDAPNATTSTEVAITIQGTNEAPVITSPAPIVVTEDTVLTDSEKLTVTDDRHDADGNPTGLTYAVSFENGAKGPIAEGDYGSLYVRADGTYAYQLNNQLQAVQELESGKTLTETFTIYVTDADGEVVSTSVTVTINGTDDAPVLSLDAPVLTVKEGAENAVEGKATATDADKVDQGKLSYSFDGGMTETDEGGNTYSVLETDYGTFRINTQTGEYSFTIDNDSEAVKNLRPTDVKDVLATVVVSNGRENSVEQTLTVHVSGSETAPEVTVEGSVKPNWTDTGAPVGEGWGGSDGFIGKIQATGWDAGPDPEHPDTDTLSYALDGSHPVTMGGKVWRVATTPKGTLYLNPETGEYRYEPSGNVQTLSEDETQTDSFAVTVTDSTGKTVTETLSVTITGTNQEPEISSNEVFGNSGTLTFSDIDASDTHTVTFDDLYAGGTDQPVHLSVNTANLSDTPFGDVSVYNENGDLIGTMKFTFTKGDGNQGNKLTYTFTPDKAYENSLEVDESVDVSLNLTVTDSAKTTGSDNDDNNNHFTITNANDDVVIDSQLEDVTIDSAEESAGGSFTFTDADVKDTHSVSSSVQVTLPGETSQKTAQVDAETGEVKLNGTVLGTLEVTRNNDSTGGETGQVSYTFKPSSDYLTSLGKGESTQLDLVFTVSDGNGSEKTTSVSVTLTGSNDVVSISSDNFSTTPNEDGVYTGLLVFSDKDVSDTHTVTFDKLFVGGDGDEHKPLSVNTADLSENSSVSVYDEDGVLIGSMQFEFTKGDNNQNNKLSYTFTPVDPNSLPVGEHSVNFTVSVDDGNGSTDSLNTVYTVTLTNANDDVIISSGESTLTPDENGEYQGSFTFTDADVKDTHSVSSSVQVTLPGETSQKTAQVDAETGEVKLNGTVLGTITANLSEPTGGASGKVSYTFEPSSEYLTSLGTDETTQLDLTFSVSDGHSTKETTPVSVTLTGSNDEVNISSGESSLTPSDDGAYTGSLVFSDADVTDTHTVTFKGLYATAEGSNGDALRVDTATDSMPTDAVPVYNENGVEIGTMEFDFGKDNGNQELSYTFKPAENLTENLAVEVSVSDGHETEAAPAPKVTVTFKPEEVELPDVPEGSGDGSEAEEEQARMNQENGLLTAAMVVSGLNGVLDASFDAPLFDAQTDAPDVPEGQDMFTADSLVLPDAPDAPAFAVADASAEHAAPQMFSLHADPVIPDATMHESAADVPEASPADDASSDAPDLISLLADSDPGAPEHGFLFGAPEGDVFSGSDGNDYMAGGDGSDAVMAGDGNDIVVYDGNDYLIDGGSGIDFIVSNDDSLSLNKLLTESGRDGHTGPIVNGVEVLIKGDDALSLTSMDQLSKDYGVTIGHDAQGNETLTLNADQWHANGDGSFDYVGQPNVDLTLETSLTPVTHDDAADAAVQQQVFILQNTQG